MPQQSVHAQMDLETLIAEAEARGEHRGRVAARTAARAWLERMFRMYSLVNGLLYAVIGAAIFATGRPTASFLMSPALWSSLFFGAGLILLQSLIRPDLLWLRRMAVMALVGVTAFAAVVSIVNSLASTQTRSSTIVLIMIWFYLLSEHFIAIVAVYQDETFPSVTQMVGRLVTWTQRVSGLGAHGAGSAMVRAAKHAGSALVAAVRRLRYDAGQEE